MKIRNTLPLAIAALLFACTNSETTENTTTSADTIVTEEAVIPEEELVVYDTNDVYSLLKSVEIANGGKALYRSKKNVEYDYYYVKPDSLMDISKERYIFKNEVSWASYSTHEVNIPTQLEGEVVQYYDGWKAYSRANYQTVKDKTALVLCKFLRKANYMWFNMMFKLNDPGVIAEYQGQKEQNGTTYDLVHISYESKQTGKAMNDRYVLYINPESHLVDYFNFSLPFAGVVEPTLFAELTYEEIDGIQVAVHRTMYDQNTASGEDSIIVEQSLENVKFNNAFTKKDLAIN